MLRHLIAARPELAYRNEPDKMPFSVAAILRAKVDRLPMPEREYEALRLWSKAAGEPEFTGISPYIGWGALARSMGVQSGAKGGYAVGVDTGPMAEALRGSSIIVACGAQTLPGLTSNVTLPREVSTGTSTWVGPATAPASDAEPTLGAISVSPKTCVTLISSISVQLVRSSAAETYLPRCISANTGDALDRAVISGAGGVEPLGIMKSTGVTTVSGSSITWATISGMRKTALDNGADEASLVWLAAPNVQNILAAREKAAGSGFIWANGSIDDIRAVATKRVPDNHLILAPMSNVIIAGFGPGPTVDVSESSGFNAATVSMRMVLFADVVLQNPAAFVVSSTVS